MLSIQSTKPQKCTPNLLPARINHNGPIDNTSQYWKPETDSKGTQHVHFRGRHLHGTVVPLPEKYTGAVLHVTDKQLPQSRSQTRAEGSGDEEEEEGVAEEIKIAEQVGEFEDMVVWGHGGQVDVGQDMFVRGLTEWVGFAESMHVDEEEDSGEKAT
ncbi:ribonuclease H1 small subunit [Dothidotthia symphoricarpi CBS 119687]|uniref:Ribonuclease H1 small subunit n=1 Tax=Dothidotthia symphoricarpi CBS 119687 TaxID=1392245 RepID=A0A6A6AD24_9PLEO|nr:ribonuclease H1 small subunit [Dothidotthia symphoricarpi CBS 119687]KAF2129456.1 ribonuclease H1 small subunit [Dothidotthia symphoricarpi CBS 119687]